jgi:hypothetical protein
MAVAEAAVDELRRLGDQWKLDEEIVPEGCGSFDAEEVHRSLTLYLHVHECKAFRAPCPPVLG